MDNFFKLIEDKKMQKKFIKAVASSNSEDPAIMEFDRLLECLDRGFFNTLQEAIENTEYVYNSIVNSTEYTKEQKQNALNYYYGRILLNHLRTLEENNLKDSSSKLLTDKDLKLLEEKAKEKITTNNDEKIKSC